MTDNPVDEVARFIRERYPGISFGDDDDIFALGMVNSLFAAELVLFMENVIGRQIPNEELEIANFRSVRAMRDLAQRLGVRAERE